MRGTQAASLPVGSVRTVALESVDHSHLAAHVPPQAMLALGILGVTHGGTSDTATHGHVMIVDE